MRPASCRCRCGIWLALSLLASAAWSAEPLHWHADLKAASQKARDEGRLLFVLHLSGDFTSESTELRPFIVYRTLALLDEAVQEIFTSKYVLAFRHVGRPAVLVPEDPPRAKPRQPTPADEFAVAYICLPDSRVVHLVPGFVTSRELLKELAFAAECHADLVRFPEGEQSAALRQAHLDKTSEKTRQRFEKGDKEAEKRSGNPDVKDIGRTIRAARVVFEQRLADRFGPTWESAEFPAVAQALAAQHGSGGDETHLVLAEHPLATLEEMAEPVYTLWGGHRFWKASGRDGEVAAWIAERGGLGRPLLLAIDAENLGPATKGRKDPLAWPIPGSFPLPHRDDFHVLRLSLDDLAVWLTQKELGPLRYPSGQMIRFVVFDRLGELVGAVSEREGRSKLASLMRIATHTGETAVSKERADK